MSTIQPPSAGVGHVGPIPLASSNLASPRSAPGSKPGYVHFAGGMTSGILSAAMLQPMDLLKTRVQQSYDSAGSNGKPDSIRRPPTLSRIIAAIVSPKAPGSVVSASAIASARTPTLLFGTVRELWRGTAPSIIRTGGGAALYFSGLDFLRNQCVRLNVGTVAPSSISQSNPNSKSATSIANSLTSTTNLIVGALARTAAGLIMMPVTVIKVRMESSDSHTGMTTPTDGRKAKIRIPTPFHGVTGQVLDQSMVPVGRPIHPTIRSVASHVIRSDGLIRGLFAGSAVTALRDAPYAGLYVVFYEHAKTTLTTAISTSSLGSSESGSTGAIVTFTSGVVAAGMATIVTNPLDAVKTRLQLYPDRYAGIFDCLRSIFQPVHVVSSSNGTGRLSVRQRVDNLVGPVRVLFSGLGLRMARKGVASAISWTVYEEVVKRW